MTIDFMLPKVKYLGKDIPRILACFSLLLSCVEYVASFSSVEGYDGLACVDGRTAGPILP